MSYHPHQEVDRTMDSNGGLAVPFVGNARRDHNNHVSVAGPGDANGLANHFMNMSLGPVGGGNSPAPLSMGQGTTYMIGADGQLMLAQMPAPGMPHGTEQLYPGFGIAPNCYAAPYGAMPMPFMPFTPGRAPAAQARADRGHNDVPGLENRRGSYSTTESTPATPFYGGISHRDPGPRVAGVDRSQYTTPSPQQLAMASLHVESSAKANAPTISDCSLDELLKSEPPVPKAVPAVFTPPGQMKTLEQSLENRIPGNRNVYIRGLHPTTDDDLLLSYAARFGAVETSKAIIDTGTGACKGFGFAKFFDVHDSEMCIRGFHRLGYEVGFARESFNSRLKAEGDDGSTNLYISNLPKSLTEVELGTIFLGYTILSSKILRDSMGNSRGVGFARFETRDVCDEIVRKFNGLGIGEEGLLMNIRYADTPAQKELKRVTAERRQFRTNEYNIGAYGTPLVGMPPNLYSAQQSTQWRRTAPMTRSGISSSSSHNESVPEDHSAAAQASTGTDTDGSEVTPESSECEDGVTIRVDPESGTAVVKAEPDSPTANRDVAKKVAK